MRVFFGKCAIVLFRPAALAAFLMFRFAAARCFFVAIFLANLCAPKVTLASQRRRFRVRAAFFAAAERERAERCPATRFACLDKACFEAELRLSRLSARFVARERFKDGFVRRPARPLAISRFA